MHHLLEAYLDIKRDFDNCCLIMVGDGNLKSKLQTLCKNSRIKDVKFTGWLDEDKALIYYAISNLFVLPTLSDLCPLVINEAMACSLPVITTNVVGCANDMINPNKNGIIVEAKNIEQLSSAIRSLIAKDELMEKMGNESLKIIKAEFTVDKTIENFVSAIEYGLSNAK